MRPKKRDLHELPFTENVKSEAFKLASEMAVETAFYIFLTLLFPGSRILRPGILILYVEYLAGCRNLFGRADFSSPTFS